MFDNKNAHISQHTKTERERLRIVFTRQLASSFSRCIMNTRRHIDCSRYVYVQLTLSTLQVVHFLDLVDYSQILEKLFRMFTAVRQNLDPGLEPAAQ